MGKGLAPILSDLEDAGAPIMETIINLLKPLTDKKKKKKKPKPVVTYEDEENTIIKLLFILFQTSKAYFCISYFISKHIQNGIAWKNALTNYL